MSWLGETLYHTTVTIRFWCWAWLWSGGQLRGRGLGGGWRGRCSPRDCRVRWAGCRCPPRCSRSASWHVGRAVEGVASHRGYLSFLQPKKVKGWIIHSAQIFAVSITTVFSTSDLAIWYSKTSDKGSSVKGQPPKMDTLSEPIHICKEDNLDCIH